MIPSKTLQFPLTSGLDEGKDPRAVAPGTLITMKNCAWTKDGRLDKRNGTVGLAKTRTDAGEISSAVRLVTREGELGLIDSSGQFFSYLTDAGTWKPVGQVPELGLEWESLATPGLGVRSADFAKTSDGKLVHAYVVGDPTQLDLASPVGIVGYIIVEIIDLATGTLLSRQSFDDGVTGFRLAANIRVVTSGTRWAVVFSEPQKRVSIIKDDFSYAVLATDGNGNAITGGKYTAFDVFTSNTNVFTLAYAQDNTNVTGNYRLVVMAYDFDANVSHAAVQVDFDTEIISVGISSDGQHLYAMWGRQGASSRVAYAVHDPFTLAQTQATVSLDATANMTPSHVGVCRRDTSSAYFAWSARTASAGSDYSSGVTRSKVGTATGTLSASRYSFNTRMTTRPFTMNGVAYMFLSDYAANRDAIDLTDAQNPFPGVNSYLVAIHDTTLGLFDMYPHRYVGRVDVLTGGEWAQGSLPDVTALSSTTIIAPMPLVVESPLKPYVWMQGDRKVTITRGADLPDDTYRSIQLGPEAWQAGAHLFVYDSQRIFDAFFPRTTPIAFNTTTTGTSGAMVAGAYIYALYPSFRSAAEVEHRGPTSPQLSYTVLASGSVLLAFIPQTLGWKGNDSMVTLSGAISQADELAGVRNVVHRTEKGGELLHILTVPPQDNVAQNYATAPTLSNLDTRADSNISSSIAMKLSRRPVIYSAAELDDYAPPAFVTIHDHKGRAFGISGDRRTVWYSKDISENPGVAPGFHPSAILIFEDPLTALSTIDTRVIVYSETGIWYVEGQGPAANGDGSDYAAIRIQSDVGCVNARAVCDMPMGTMFLSDRGIYLLDRKLELSWVGKPVRDTLAAYPNVTSAVLVSALNQVRFSCNSVAGTSGVVLVFDYARSEWLTFEYSDGATPRTPIADAVVVDTYTFVTPSGKVYQESASTYLDDGQWVAFDVETADILADGPLSYKRVRRAYLYGEQYTDCDLSVRIAMKGQISYSQTREWASVDVAEIGSANIGVHIQNQKANGIRMRITDASPSSPGATVGTGQGINLSALGFEIAPKQGMDKRGAEAKK